MADMAQLVGLELMLTGIGNELRKAKELQLQLIKTIIFYKTFVFLHDIFLR